jgi:hypothetical protein
LEWAKLESGHWAAEGRVAIDSAGRAVAIWSYFDGSDSIIQWAAREGEGFTKPAQLSASGQDAGEPAIGVDSGGDALAVWARNNGSNRTIQAAARAPAGSFVP